MKIQTMANSSQVELSDQQETNNSQNIVKHENNAMVNTEVYIKMEPPEDDSEFPVNPSPSFEMYACSSVKSEKDDINPNMHSENTEDRNMCDPLIGSIEMKENKKKRKRTQNTSSEQYEVFVKYLENNFHFRSNIVSPIIGENYLQQKWIELTNHLNSIGGPRLPVDEWKKRFGDWKYATRSKYRKIKDGIDLKLNPIEEKALFLWDNIVVTPPPFVPNNNGLQKKIEDNNVLPNFVDENIVTDLPLESTVTSTKQNGFLLENPAVVPTTNPAVGNNHIQEEHEVKPMSHPSANEHSNELADVLNKFSSEYLSLQNKKQKFERLKLKFEIAKFKHQNPGFEFDF